MTLDGPLATHCCEQNSACRTRQPSRAFRAAQHVHGATKKSPTKKYMFSLIYLKLRRLTTLTCLWSLLHTPHQNFCPQSGPEHSESELCE